MCEKLQSYACSGVPRASTRGRSHRSCRKSEAARRAHRVWADAFHLRVARRIVAPVTLGRRVAASLAALAAAGGLAAGCGGDGADVMRATLTDQGCTYEGDTTPSPGLFTIQVRNESRYVTNFPLWELAEGSKLRRSSRRTRRRSASGSRRGRPISIPRSSRGRFPRRWSAPARQQPVAHQILPMRPAVAL
jgi:hypothetical protein